MEKRGDWLVEITLLICCTGVAWAQQRGGPPGTAPPTSSSGPTEQSSQSAVNTPSPEAGETKPAKPAVTPLSGATDFSPGFQGEARSYLVPAIQWTGFGDTSTGSTTAETRVQAQSTIVGSLTLQRVRRHSQLNLDYAGGGFFYSRRLKSSSNFDSPTNGVLHRLGFVQQFTWPRWQLQLSDDGLYLPESPFGFSGFGGLESFGLGLGGGFFRQAPSLNPTFQPNQTILTGRTQRLSNVAVTQIQFNPKPRSALTLTGTYGTLFFTNPAFLDSRYWMLMAGYNFAVTRKNTVGINYGHYFLQLGAPNRELLYRGLELAYGRKVTGKLSLELSAGAMVNQVAKELGGSVTKVFWTTRDSLQCRFRRGSVSIAFWRNVTSGSGILVGAETYVTQFSAGRQFWRKAYASLDFGHAFNQSLSPELAARQRRKFETWHGGARLSREFGQHTSIYLNYTLQRQISNDPFCFGDSCGRVLLRHVGGIGLNWHGRPIGLD